MKPTVGSIVRLLGRPRVLLDCVRWGLHNHGGRIGKMRSTRQNLVKLPIDDHACLEVFWKDLTHGQGPAVALVIHGEEILRIDCFGPGIGHLHAAFFNPAKGEDRLFLSEQSAEAQIDRAAFELTHNLTYYQSRVSNEQVRKHTVNDDALGKAVAEAVALMRGFLESP